MGFIKRAFLYVQRKKGKSVLLFAILLIMATFVLTGLSIWNATTTTQQNLRQSLGGKFIVGVDWSETNPYIHKDSIGDGNWLYYSEKQISSEMVNQMKQIKGIRSCDAFVESLYEFNELSLFPGNLATEEEFAHLVKSIGVWRSEENGQFTSGNLALTKGRHITENDTGKAIINKDLAEKSNLNIGDTISTKSTKGKIIEAEIIGLFEAKEKEKPTELIMTSEKVQNRVFLDSATIIALDDENSTIQGFTDLTATVDDPENMEQIISEVKKIRSFDWKGFTVTKDNEAYLKALQPLTNLSNLIITLLTIIVIVSIIILSLILTLWGKTRIHETGVFLALGIKKSAIIGQYLVEVLSIALLAFCLSYFSSNAIANQIGTSLLQDSIQKKENNIAEQKDGNSVLTNTPEASLTDNKINPNTEVMDMQISVDVNNLIQLYFIGSVIIIISVCVSSITLMRLKPREILSKMS